MTPGVADLDHLRENGESVSQVSVSLNARIENFRVHRLFLLWRQENFSTAISYLSDLMPVSSYSNLISLIGLYVSPRVCFFSQSSSNLHAF